MRQATRAAAASRITPPTPTTTPMIVLRVLEDIPLELLLDLSELRDATLVEVGVVTISLVEDMVVPSEVTTTTVVRVDGATVEVLDLSEVTEGLEEVSFAESVEDDDVSSVLDAVELELDSESSELELELELELDVVSGDDEVGADEVVGLGVVDGEADVVAECVVRVSGEDVVEATELVLDDVLEDVSELGPLRMPFCLAIISTTFPSQVA